MRVLHLPENIASQSSVTVRALLDIGVDARGIVVGSSDSQMSDSLYVIPAFDVKWSFAKKFQWRANCFRHLAWADVVHWHYGYSSLFQRAMLTWSKLLGKAQFIEFWGSDIRVPEVEAFDNPYFAEIIGLHEYRDAESSINSRKRQLIFNNAGAHVLCSVGMKEHLCADLFPRRTHVPQRIELDSIPLSYPDPECNNPVVVHAPTAPIIKGSSVVIEAMKQITSTRLCSFDLVCGVPRVEALRRMSACDIYVDQLRIGHHGLAALEAMAMGKPVVAYIKPAMRAQYPPDFPIVCADPQSLPQVLGELIADGKLRRRIGEAGRRYVQLHHNSRTVAIELRRLYSEELRIIRG